jgi:diguanylate cyclase (GGDEF)-like protein
MDLIMEDLIDKVLLITDFQTGWIVFREAHQFRLKTSRGISTDFQKHIIKGDLDLLCPDALKVNEPLYIFGPPVLSKMQLLRDEGIDFLVALPLISNHKPTGLLFLAGRVSREVDSDLAALLSLVGNHVSHIIDKIRLFEETKRLSITDGLTGLYNSRYFYRYLELEIARTRRYGRSFSLILFDIDDFKRFNDTYGHQAGDEALQALARVLQSVSRESDTVVRYGGEEFIIILPNTSEEEAIALANRILQSVQKTKIKISAAAKVNITLSGGIASYPLNAVSAKALLNAADNAMYAAKSAGKNTIICFQGKKT